MTMSIDTPQGGARASGEPIARTWIIFRLIKDKRCTDGEHWVPIGWVCQDNEQQAKLEAHKIFRRYDEETLKMVRTEKGFGWLV